MKDIEADVPEVQSCFRRVENKVAVSVPPVQHCDEKLPPYGTWSQIGPGRIAAVAFAFEARGVRTIMLQLQVVTEVV